MAITVSVIVLSVSVAGSTLRMMTPAANRRAHAARRLGDRLIASVRDLELLALRTAGWVLPRPTGAPRSVPIRILAHVPSFVPVVRAGSEISMATTLQLLAARGHETRVVVDRDGITGQVDGLDVVTKPSWKDLVAAYRWADVVFTQLDSRNAAMRLGALTHTPVVHFLRMGGLSKAGMLGRPDLVVFNAEWLRRRTESTGPSIVVHPPLVAERYETSRGDAVTLVNLNPRKGGALFVELARRRPDLEFLGVVGGWGTQEVSEPKPPNLTVMAPVADMREVYSRTRVLVMLSDHESFGRTGVEAACSGIPTIATPIDGVREALGDAALYADRDDLDQWMECLRLLDDSAEYRRRSKAARARADLIAVRTGEEIEGLERWMLTEVQRRTR